jgi:hypothetical protein
VWPAFWLTDEANWPVHGEIDIVEGVNYQNVAKTALHSTKGCSMEDIPLGTMTGEWDTAQGIPDAKTGESSFQLCHFFLKNINLTIMFSWTTGIRHPGHDVALR